MIGITVLSLKLDVRSSTQSNSKIDPNLLWKLITSTTVYITYRLEDVYRIWTQQANLHVKRFQIENKNKNKKKEGRKMH